MLFAGEYRTNTVEPGECRFKTISGSSGSVVGKWKVVFRTLNRMDQNGPQTSDFTCSTVIYEFSKNGILKIYSDDKRFKVMISELNYRIEKMIDQFQR